jgi:hypothetical protein
MSRVPFPYSLCQCYSYLSMTRWIGKTASSQALETKREGKVVRLYPLGVNVSLQVRAFVELWYVDLDRLASSEQPLLVLVMGTGRRYSNTCRPKSQ